MSGCTVVLLADGTVVKKGSRIIIDERFALDLATDLKLPVPRVYEAHSINSDEGVSIRMDFIAGERLDKIWSKLSSNEKDGICGQLRSILKTMRSVPWTSGVIGSCSGGPARDCRLYSDYIDGPFSDELAFNAFYCDLLSTAPKPIHEALRNNLRSNHRVVFSHGDLSQHNIIVQNGKISGLIDWEYSGWYPEHWDYIKFFDRPCSHRDWKDRAGDIFPQRYDQELTVHQAILRWQRP